MYRTGKKLMAALLCAVLCVSATEVHAVQIDNYEESTYTSALTESVSEETTSTEISSELTESEEHSSNLPETNLDQPESGEAQTSEIESDFSETSEAETVETEPVEIETEEQVSETQEEAASTETVSESETELESETESKTELESELETETTLTETETDIENPVQTESELRDALKRRMETDGFIASGYIDSGMEAEPLGNSKSSVFTLSERSVPSQYSALEHGQDTAVKDQGSWGSCWSFAAVAPAESQYKALTGTEADMSESHLVNFFYHNDLTGPDGGLEGDAVIPLATTKVNNGGNNMFTTFAMARWTGIADEKTHASLVYPQRRTDQPDKGAEYSTGICTHRSRPYAERLLDS